MGVVYKAEDTSLRRTVALKFLPARLVSQKNEKTRFIREAQAAAALHHTNICTVYEVDEAEGQVFISMAYIAGQNLADKIESEPLSIDHAVDVAIQVGRALQARVHGRPHHETRTVQVGAVLFLKPAPNLLGEVRCRVLG